MKPFDTVIYELRKSDHPIEKIISSSAYWVPLQMLYVELVKNKDIVPLSDIEFDKKGYYWNIALSTGRREQFFRISICQALYVWDWVSGN